MKENNGTGSDRKSQLIKNRLETEEEAKIEQRPLAFSQFAFLWFPDSILVIVLLSIRRALDSSKGRSTFIKLIVVDVILSVL